MEQRPSVPAAGDVLEGKIEIVRLLGAGGMGAVFEARNRRTGRQVAVKMLRAELATNAEACQRFLQDLRMGAERSRHRRWVLVAAAVAVPIAAVLLLWVLLSRPSPPEPPAATAPGVGFPAGPPTPVLPAAVVPPPAPNAPVPAIEPSVRGDAGSPAPPEPDARARPAERRRTPGLRVPPAEGVPVQEAPRAPAPAQPSPPPHQPRAPEPDDDRGIL